MHVKAGWRSVLKADGEQSVTLVGTAEMQQWHVGNWDTLPLVSERIILSKDKLHSQLSLLYRLYSTYECLLWARKWSHMAWSIILHWK